jgi:lysophospholipase L1-like esterase
METLTRSVFLKGALAMTALGLTTCARAEMYSYRVVCIGDSITAGHPHPKRYSYPAVLDRRASWTVFNKGIPGDYAVEMPQRLERDAISKNPAYYVALAGINGVLRGYSDDARIQRYLSEGWEMVRRDGITPVVCTLLPVSGRGAEAQRRVSLLNRWIRLEAKRRKFPLADLYVSMKAKEGPELSKAYSGDGLHPNPKGSAKMAGGAAEAILTAA